jgi:hypothetical protein
VLPSIPLLAGLIAARDTAVFGAATRRTMRGIVPTMRGGLILPAGKYAADAEARFAWRTSRGATAAAAGRFKVILARALAADAVATVAGPPAAYAVPEQSTAHPNNSG